MQLTTKRRALHVAETSCPRHHPRLQLVRWRPTTKPTVFRYYLMATTLQQQKKKPPLILSEPALLKTSDPPSLNNHKWTPTYVMLAVVLSERKCSAVLRVAAAAARASSHDYNVGSGG